MGAAVKEAKGKNAGWAEADEINACSFVILVAHVAFLLATSHLGAFGEAKVLSFMCFRYLVGVTLMGVGFHYFDVHRRTHVRDKTYTYWEEEFHHVCIVKICIMYRSWGLLNHSEPASHFHFALKTNWIVVTWVIGFRFCTRCLGILTPQPEGSVWLNWTTPPEWIILHSNSLVQDIMWGIFGTLLSDFLRYWGHRLGHHNFFYKTFPFAHAHHHNQMYLHPLITAVSPLFHIALWGTYLPYAFFWSQGLFMPGYIMGGVTSFASVTQHLGCDPLPWLSKLNHHLCGIIPWIPVYHQYHHIPFVRGGNYGNTTVFWDYLFGTVIPESVEHIQTGKMPENVRRWVQHPKAEKVWADMLANKNRLDLNSSWDTILNFSCID